MAVQPGRRYATTVATPVATSTSTPRAASVETFDFCVVT
jgi:hypothetical protein